MAVYPSVIIVEDEAINVLFLKLLLESNQVKVLDEADDFESAYRKITTIKPDFIIVDIKLNNNSSGIDLVEKLQNETGPFQHIYCTAYSDDSILSLCQKTQPVGILNKPIEESKLKALLAQIKNN